MSLLLKIWMVLLFGFLGSVIIGLTVLLYFMNFWAGIGMTAFMLFVGGGVGLMIRESLKW